MISFAGYPLLVEGRTVGVVAMFARQCLEPDTIEALESVAPIIAQGVERQRTQDTLRETQAELAHLNRVMTVGELTASIAHEINQPLAAIVMNGNAALRWLAFDPPNLAKARDSAELIIRDGDRASQVIARIRALLKKSPPSKTLLDVNEFVNEVVNLTQTLLLFARFCHFGLPSERQEVPAPAHQPRDGRYRGRELIEGKDQCPRGQDERRDVDGQSAKGTRGRVGWKRAVESNADVGIAGHRERRDAPERAGRKDHLKQRHDWQEDREHRIEEKEGAVLRRGTDGHRDGAGR
jgi:signal transduction histidine kinase